MRYDSKIIKLQYKYQTSEEKTKINELGGK